MPKTVEIELTYSTAWSGPDAGPDMNDKAPSGQPWCNVAASIYLKIVGMKPQWSDLGEVAQKTWIDAAKQAFAFAAKS